jgi:periplasmic nitrate reductase NapD
VDLADDSRATRPAAAMNEALHIASLIVRARPEVAPAVAERIASEPGVEVHAVDSGRIIVVLEASTERALADWMDSLRQQPDVLLVNLVYHQVESA